MLKSKEKVFLLSVISDLALGAGTLKSFNVDLIVITQGLFNFDLRGGAAILFVQ